MPIVKNYDYITACRRDVESAARSEGVFRIPETDKKIIVFKKRDQVLYGLLDPSALLAEGQAGRIYSLFLLDPQTGYVINSERAEFVVKDIPCPLTDSQVQRESRFANLFYFALAVNGLEEGRSYLILDYINGIPLESLMGDLSAKLSLTQRLKMITELSHIFLRLHQEGTHRDVHLGNVLVDLETGSIQLVDFGEAVELSDDALSFEGRHGKIALHHPPESMPPSALTVITSTYTPPSDVFSLAAFIIKLLNGSSPYKTRNEKIQAYSRLNLLTTIHARTTSHFSTESAAYEAANELETLRKEIYSTSFDLEGMENFSQWALPEIGDIDFAAVVKMFLSRMQSINPENRPDMEEVTKFFEILFRLSRHFEPSMEYSFDFNDKLVAVLQLLILAAGLWKSKIGDHEAALEYNCSDIRFDLHGNITACARVLLISNVIQVLKEEDKGVLRESLFPLILPILQSAPQFNFSQQVLDDDLEHLLHVQNAYLTAKSFRTERAVEMVTFCAGVNELNERLQKKSIAPNEKTISFARLWLFVGGYHFQEAVAGGSSSTSRNLSLSDINLAEHLKFCEIVNKLGNTTTLLVLEVLDRLVGELREGADANETSLVSKLFAENSEEKWRAILKAEGLACWEPSPDEMRMARENQEEVRRPMVVSSTCTPSAASSTLQRSSAQEVSEIVQGMVQQAVTLSELNMFSRGKADSLAGQQAISLTVL